MRKILKADFQINIRRFQFLFLNEKTGFFQASPDQPSGRRFTKHRFEISLERRQTPPGQKCKSLQSHIEFIVAVHESFDIYPGRDTKIKKNSGNRWLDLQKYQ